MRAENVRANGRCRVSKDEVFQPWLKERGIEDVEAFVPVVAPEVEFYLLSPHSDPNEEAEPPEGRLGWTEGARQPYSIDTMRSILGDDFVSLY